MNKSCLCVSFFMAYYILKHKQVNIAYNVEILIRF